MNIAIIGFGTVGTGVYDAAERTNGAVKVVRILDIRTVPGFEKLITPDIEQIVGDPSIDLVVETMGGEEPANTFVMKAIAAGKHVVSANKQLICAKYAVLMNAAAQHGVQLRFTASAGGGIPWLYNLRRAKRCDEILEISGIVNGTTNFILDAMNTRGEDYADALKTAQQLGYAEANPAADVNGYDAQRKCAISASIAFDTVVEEGMVPTEGIQHFGRAAAHAIQELPETKGRVVKLLMHAGRHGDGVFAYVAPALVRANSLEANVPSNFNLITFRAKYVGVQSYFGQGAGKDPTGTSVVQDILDIASGSLSGAPAQGKPLSKNGEVERDFFIYDGERAIAARMNVSAVFGYAEKARAQGKPVFFGEIAD
ncbi:MAG TPA: homoserine dehydrogenase [Clostridia bacterium]|nr:homoserine dehydrogenase [Clostridia bacterium]